jgi:hypothetical protein
MRAHEPLDPPTSRDEPPHEEEPTRVQRVVSLLNGVGGQHVDLKDHLLFRSVQEEQVFAVRILSQAHNLDTVVRISELASFARADGFVADLGLDRGGVGDVLEPGDGTSTAERRVGGKARATTSPRVGDGQVLAKLARRPTMRTGR